MSHKITLDQAADCADRANVMLLMLCSALKEMNVTDIQTAVEMASELVDSVTVWLIEEQVRREKADA